MKGILGMGNARSKQRRIQINYCGETACGRALFLLVKLYLEESGGRMNRGNEHGEI